MPIVGALFAGFVAVLIALVSNGLTDALIVLAIIVVVQQLEGNVFQPMIQSRGLGLHAAVVLVAVTLGGNLAGIVGSLLAVPVAALIAVVWNYVREQLSEPRREPETDPAPDGAGARRSAAAHRPQRQAAMLHGGLPSSRALGRDRPTGLPSRSGRCGLTPPFDSLRVRQLPVQGRPGAGRSEL